MLGPRMYPGSFQAIPLLADCVRNGQFALRAELKQMAPIVIPITNAMPIKDSFPGHCVSPDSSIDV